jgi:hypothetical protein
MVFFRDIHYRLFIPLPLRSLTYTFSNDFTLLN